MQLSVTYNRTNSQSIVTYNNRSYKRVLTYNKTVIQLVGEERVRQFTEVHFDKGADTVHVLHVLIFG